MYGTYFVGLAAPPFQVEVADGRRANATFFPGESWVLLGSSGALKELDDARAR